ncbi:hypothetical protein ACFY05_16545 [Microtetraspora fusca]|uniref:Polysaccharide chain length determinant N-terminal domain-containing protein n=1 Tax=Microtetraspora fusca TaxID=1997 RepID=A0ABW6V578_MICFU
MEFWKAVAALARNRFVGPPLLALALVAGVVAFLAVPGGYRTDTSLVLATPTNGGVLSRDPNRPTGQANPLLQFSDALRTAASIVIQSVNTEESRARVGAPKDGPVDLVIDDGRSNPRVLDISGPYVYIAVEAPSEKTASEVLTATRQRVVDEVVDWQKELGAPPPTFLTVATIVPPSTPEPVTRARWQAAAGAGLLVLAGGLCVAYGLARRKARRVRQETPAEAATPETAEEFERAENAIPETAEKVATTSGDDGD